MARVEDTTRYSRADFIRIMGLGISGSVLAIGCTKQPVPTTPKVDLGIHRELGVWNQEEVEALAKRMAANTQFNNLAYAGAALSENQQGRPAFSKVGSIFSDDKVKLSTVRNIDPAESGMNVLKRTPAGALIEINGPEFTASLRSKIGGPDLKMVVPSSLKMKEIQIDGEVTKEYSEFMMQFLVAKEILTIQAFDMVANYIVTNVLYDEYEKPQDTRIKKGVEASTINSGFGQVPTRFMADLWGHYLLVPDYLSATAQGKFSQEELNGDVLRIFKMAAETFLKAGILLPDQGGGYKWTEDSNKFYETWINFSVAGYKALHR